MNILFISHENALNGASLSLLGIIDELKQNNTIYVLTNYREGIFIDELKKRNVNIIYSRYRWWMAYKPKNKFKWIIKRILCLILCQVNYVSALKLKNKIKKESIQIIHTNTSVINIGAILSKLCKIPHVFHIREYPQEGLNLHCVYSKKYTLNYIKNNSDYIITVSKALYSVYKNKLDEEKMTVIYNGINEKNIQKKDFSQDKKNINILISGAINEGKGQKYAVLALNEIVKRGHNNVDLSIAGSGDIKPIKDLIDKLNLNENIKILGRVNNLVEVRKDIDLELVCSKFEAFGRVTVEAMMGMIPVIGANTGGTKELIIDGYNGLLYEQGNYVDLADKIEWFINDRNKLRELGENAYSFAKDFTSSRNASNIYKIYNQLINYQ